MTLLQTLNEKYDWPKWKTWLYGVGCSLFGYWMAS